MKLLLQIFSTLLSIAVILALFLSILVVAEMKSWTYLLLYIPVFLAIYEVEKINIRKKKNSHTHNRFSGS